MKIFRAELTPHPRGSLSAPALSEHYSMPPVSLTCTAVSQVPDQVPVSTSTASLLSRAGSQPSATALCNPIVETSCHGDASTGPADTSFLRRPFGKSLPPGTLKPAILAAVLVAGIVAALVTSDQLLQRRGFAEESRFTDPALRRLVDESPSEPRGSQRGYQTAGHDEEGMTYVKTIATETIQGDSDATGSTAMSSTSTRRSHKTTRHRPLSSSRRSGRGVSRTNIGSGKRTRSPKYTSLRWRFATSSGEDRKRVGRLRTRKGKHALQTHGTRFSGRLLAVTRGINPVSLKDISLDAAVPSRRTGGIKIGLHTATSSNKEIAE